MDEEADNRTLMILSDLLNKHIRFEERELFNYLEETLTSEKLDEIFLKLEELPLKNEEWNEEFWVRE